VPVQAGHGGAEARAPRPERLPAPGERASSGNAAERAAMPPAPLDSLFARAAQQVPTWSTIALRVPARPGAPVSLTISDGAHWNRFARSTMTVDSGSGAVVRWEPYAATSAGQKLRGWIRFAHTGELGGAPGEAIAGLACLGGAFLVYTGIALSLRRVAAWRARSSARSAAMVGLEVR
jgi:uncharacterized iron-regulated membrane protein